jgi:hypothetical protein
MPGRAFGRVMQKCSRRQLQGDHPPALGDERVVDEVDVEVARWLEGDEEQRIPHHLQFGDAVADALPDGRRGTHDGVGGGEVARLAGHQESRPR